MTYGFVKYFRPTHASNFHSLEVVGRGSETQIQVGGKLNSIKKRFKG